METVTRCKVVCVFKGEHSGGQIDVRFGGVYSTDPNHENKKFWDASPNIQFEMRVQNRPAVEHIVPGQEYYLDLIPAPKTVA